MNPLDAPPVQPSARERLEAMDVMQGILVGAALSTPVWAVVGAILATVHALTTMR